MYIQINDSLTFKNKQHENNEQQTGYSNDFHSLPWDFHFYQPSEAISQSKAKFAKTADDIKDYYYGPVQVGGYIYTIFNSQVDMENGDKEEIGAAIVGGLIMSFAEAGEKGLHRSDHY